ncbi:MAG TPA: PilX N-terminal domain-containing pilus assembly protein [Rhodanobacter sp.]|nr:PilX N-terminal domain-containing pilus assembly protein [Rhodanobacter sp.]
MASLGGSQAGSGGHPRTVRQRSASRLDARPRQGGVALVVALLLLLVITLVGLAAVHSTIMQQKMASNLYDRQVAFQSTEAALRAGEEWVTSNPKSALIRDCSALTGGACLADPFSDTNLPAASLQTVAGGSASGQFSASTIATGQPQFVVENMGTFEDPAAQGLNQTANSLQYGGGGVGQPHVYFRITARSGDPASVGGRAVVTLQTMIKQ